ncbi:MAG: 2-C-methyl-D-erythritol 4-phosphate cytidylyltransferase [Firmicutes bacterium]|nr:2-C-methyl-D-erythritol 4-phosphate cytidylyltransferase [Bacillota bacterium]
MIYACILAGGIGSRMGNEKPKQYINIGGKPIILHTIEKFCLCSEFEEILILCPRVVTYRIIKDNIEAAEKFGACDTVVPATDTIVESRDGYSITAIPSRADLYQGQTPQSFKALKLKKLYEQLTEEEKAILTDAAKIFVIKGEPVSLVRGENSNIKITYPYDLTVAESLLKQQDI